MLLRTPLLRSTAAITGLAGIALLSACTSAADASTGSNSAAAGTSGTTTSSTQAAGTNYKNGTYTASGGYSTPGGEETVKVTLTIASNDVTAVTVTGSARTANSTHYQAQFEAGIGAVVKGKSLATLEVSRVSGSSLTSGGFNAAVATIRTQAKA